MKGTTEIYAMKRMKKSEIILQNQVAHIRAERDVLAAGPLGGSGSQWLVKLYHSFQVRFASVYVFV